MQEWCTIESDPAVFTELINKIGVKNVEVSEIYDLNDDIQIQELQPIYGLIFLFRWTSKMEKREALKLYDHELFFANQVIQNACATQAIISILLNSPLDIGDELRNYKEFASSMNSKDKGLLLGNLDNLRLAHNSFARPEQFIFSGSKKAKEGDDVFHFISYIPFKNNVYELDGLQEGPIVLGEINQDVNWIQVARQAILKRVAIYQEKEIAFTLLAVKQSKRSQINSQISTLEQEICSILYTLQTTGQLTEQQNIDLQRLLTIFPQPAQLNLQPEILQSEYNAKEQQLKNAQYILQDEDAKYEKYKLENQRRKHNYIPLILELFKTAAQKGQLEGLIQNAKQKQQQQQQVKQ